MNESSQELVEGPRFRDRGSSRSRFGVSWSVSLVLFAIVVAFVAWASGYAPWIEALGFVTGAVCVWLVVRENVWNFPVGLANSATFAVVFVGSGLYAGAALQVVYFVLGCVGWYLWLYGGQGRTELRVSRAPMRELVVLGVLVVVLTLTLWRLLGYVGGSASFFDALTTALSLAAQWLLNKKRVESWIGWLAVNSIFVPLYIHQQLYLTAGLYVVFLCLAVIGLRAWLDAWRKAGGGVGP